MPPNHSEPCFPKLYSSCLHSAPSSSLAAPRTHPPKARSTRRGIAQPRVPRRALAERGRHRNHRPGTLDSHGFSNVFKVLSSFMILACSNHVIVLPGYVLLRVFESTEQLKQPRPLDAPRHQDGGPTRRVVANFWQNLLVFGCIGADLCK